MHFLEYFDDKVNSMKNFPLAFVEVRSTHLFFGFLNKLRKDLKVKRSCKSSSQRHLRSYHVAASLVPGLLVHKHVPGVVQMTRVRSCSSKTEEENEENIIKLDVSLNRQNIKWFASTPVTDFRAGRARFGISAEFSRKLVFVKNVETLFSESRLQNRGAHYTRVNTVSAKQSGIAWSTYWLEFLIAELSWIYQPQTMNNRICNNSIRVVKDMHFPWMNCCIWKWKLLSNSQLALIVSHV